MKAGLKVHASMGCMHDGRPQQSTPRVVGPTRAAGLAMQCSRLAAWDTPGIASHRSEAGCSFTTGTRLIGAAAPPPLRYLPSVPGPTTARVAWVKG